MINSFRIKMSNPIPISTVPIFAINFHDCLALKLKNEFVEDLNPINIYDDNEIDLLLNNNTSNNDIEKLINKST